MKNRVVLITGATSGIGLETARALLAQGYKVILLGRNREKCIAVTERFRQEIPGCQTDWIECDLSSLRSVSGAIQKIKDGYPVVDVLINNAGGVVQKKELSADGVEMTFAINHLGHFFLTQGILENLKAAEQGRIINVSSEASKTSKADLSDPLFESTSYSAFAAYANVKLYTILFTKKLASLLQGTHVTVNALHPGVVNTGFGDGLTGIFRLFWALARPFMTSPAKGAITSTYLATAPSLALTTGRYFKDRKSIKPNYLAEDQKLQNKLWVLSEQLVEKALK